MRANNKKEKMIDYLQWFWDTQPKLSLELSLLIVVVVMGIASLYEEWKNNNATLQSENQTAQRR